MMQAYSPHPGVQQHPGVPQGHPMAGNIQHNQGQPGMPQGMHMGVSGPGGPQVSQAGAMMAGMPPGAGPSAHALQHLNPGQAQQAQMFQQQQLAFANNPQMAHLQQQQIMQQQRQQQAARQALMAQQYSGGGPMQVMPNGMSPMNAAQFAAMRGAPMARPVNLPQHLQHAQQQAQQQNLHEQQQAQQQAQHQQQMMAHQLAMQQQQNAQQGANNPQGQPQMNPQQLQNMQHAQIAAAQQQQQQQQAQAAAQQSQQNQPQPQPQQPQQNPQTQPQQQPQPQMQQNAGMQQQQQAAAQAAAMLQQQRQVGMQGAMQQGEKLKGQCLIKLMLFGDYLSGFALQKGQDDPLKYWFTFVDKFFASGGVFRHSVLIVESGAETSIKQYEITFPALARYFHTHFEGGIKNMQMIVEKATEKQLPNNAHFIESQKASFVYWFDSGSQLIANGTLRALFDDQQKLELLEFVTSSHEEYLPRSKIIDAARPLHEWQKEWHKVNPPSEGKSSPEMNKKGKTKPMKSPAQPPPEIDLPASKIKPSMGITPSVFRFLELAEVIGQMNPLFHYSHLHPNFGPNRALDEYVATNCTVPNMQNSTGPRTPGMANFPIGASPAMQQLNLPDGSPHMGSPAQSQNMQLQQSQQGTVSSGPSANTSPNASNKRRRPSTVKEEGEGMVNGAGGAKSNVKPSPRIGGKRQKGNPA